MTESTHPDRGSIIQGDAIDWLRAQPDASVDHVICDPPFDARTHTGARYGGGGTAGSLIDFAPFGSEDLAAFVAEALRVSKRWVLAFCALEQIGSYQASAGESYLRGGFWRKPDGAPQFTGDRPGQPGEAIAIMHRTGRKRWNGGGRHAFWPFGVERHDRCHPTQKPLGLMRALVEDFTDPGDLVADPYAGSGSTGVACVQLGRRFVGVERREDYAAIARERLAAAEEGQTLADRRAGQLTMLGPI